MYEVVESCVLVGKDRSEWFELEVGLRQGCILSPILFSIFIDGLARTVKGSKAGVRVGQQVLNILLFADDLVLIAQNQKELQMLLDIVYSYSAQWRFCFNIEKSKVLVFTAKRSYPLIKYFLGFEELEVVKEYRYLGLDFESSLSWARTKERLASKARTRLPMLSRAASEGLTADAGDKIWGVMIRPVLEYGAEVWGAGSWLEAEQLQTEAGRKILGVLRKTANDVVRGEMG